MKFFHKLRKLSMIVGFILVVALFAGCAPAADEDDEAVFTVGVALALSGPVAAWGIPLLNGVRDAVDMFNEKGGLEVGDQVYRIELIDEDTEFTPEGAAAAATSLIDQGADFVVAGVASTTALAALEITEREGVLHSHFGFSDETLETEYSYRWTMPTTHTMPSTVFWIRRNEPEITRVAHISSDEESGWLIDEQLDELLPLVGMEKVITEFYPEGTTDFVPIWSRVLREDPQWVTGDPPPPGDWALIMRQGREQGFDGLFARHIPPHDAEITEITGEEYGEGYLSVGYDPGDLANDDMRQYIESYEANYDDWNAVALLGLGGMFATFEAIERAGSVDTDEIKSQLESGEDYQLPFWNAAVQLGGRDMYGRDGQLFAPTYLGRYTDGSTEVIYELPLDEMIHGWEMAREGTWE